MGGGVRWGVGGGVRWKGGVEGGAEGEVGVDFTSHSPTTAASSRCVGGRGKVGGVMGWAEGRVGAVLGGWGGAGRPGGWASRYCASGKHGRSLSTGGNCNFYPPSSSTATD